MKILEIGFDPLLWSYYPETTEFIDTSFRFEDRKGYEEKRASRLARVLALCKKGVEILKLVWLSDYEVVVCRAMGPFNAYALWQYPFRWILQKLFKIFIYIAAKGKILAVVDMTDHRTIHGNDKGLLKRCDLYFKRELADNLLGAFELIIGPWRCLGNSSRNDIIQLWAKKLKPVSLGVEEGLITPPFFEEKNLDVFYVGGDYGCIPSRRKSEELLKVLAQKGYRVNDGTRLSPEKYRASISSSWLSLSPGGVGWDCYRHYEIPALGSCAVLTPSPNKQLYPFVDKESALYVDGNLAWLDEIEVLLSDKEHLKVMTLQAQDHVSKYHTRKKIAEYLFQEISAKV